MLLRFNHQDKVMLGLRAVDRGGGTITLVEYISTKLPYKDEIIHKKATVVRIHNTQ